MTLIGRDAIQLLLVHGDAGETNGVDRFSGILPFVRAAEAGNFAQAAQLLGLTDSAVSKAVSRLEARLGVQLLLRNSKRLGLTEDGSAFLERCRSIVAEMEEAESAISKARGTARGRLRITLPIAFGRMHVLPVLREYAASDPNVAFDLTLTDEFTDLIANGVDLALRMTRDDPPDSRLVSRRVVTSFLVVCGSPAYLARAGELRTPADLRAHTCMNFTHQGRAYPYRMRQGRTTLDVPVAGRIRTNNGEALRDAALAGFGLAQLHSYIAGPEITAGRLRPVLLDHLAPGIPINVIYPQRRYAGGRVRDLIQFVVQRVRDPAPWNAFLPRSDKMSP